MSYLSRKLNVKAIRSNVIACHQDRDIYWVTLENSKGMKVRVSNYGCIIQSILVPDRNGTLTDVTLGFDRVEDYYSEEYLANNPYFGAVVGRYVNRIGDARYECDGTVYQLSRNDGNNQLHGGGSFSQKVWELNSVDEDGGSVTFTMFSPDGDQGYPGNLRATVIYELTEDNELFYTIKAVTDQFTPVNMTNHTYFNLHGDSSSIGDHILQIPAMNYFEQRNDLVVTGNILPVAGTPYDFNSPKAIGYNWNTESGYDQAFELNKSYGRWGLVGKAYSNKTGISVEAFSEEPVVQLYTGGFLNGLNGKDGLIYGKFSGFCLETHHHPNAVNIPHFPNTILRPGDVYRQRTSFRFGTED
ncbi:MAG TPA: aldose epimerase family protein [Sphingobacteriaceae bacterium]